MTTFRHYLLREYEQWFASVSNMSREDVEREMSRLEKTHTRLGRVMRDLTKPTRPSVTSGSNLERYHVQEHIRDAERRIKALWAHLGVE